MRLYKKKHPISSVDIGRYDRLMKGRGVMPYAPSEISQLINLIKLMIPLF